MTDHTDLEYVTGAVYAQLEDLHREDKIAVLKAILVDLANEREGAWPHSRQVVLITEVPDWAVIQDRKLWADMPDVVIDHEGVAQGWIDNMAENSHDMARDDGLGELCALEDMEADDASD